MNIDYENEMERERLRQESLQRIRGFRLMDDDFMSVCFKDSPEAANRVLGIILGKPDIQVRKVETQVEYRNLYGRSIRLDMVAEDSEGVYNCEIQRADRGATPRRARYHGSLMDANQSTAGEPYEDIPETFIIFITERDHFHEGKPMYRFDRHCREIDRDLEDGMHIIYVNGEYRGDDDIGRLMHDFHCTSADDMQYTELAERVRHFKEDDEGVRSMCRSIEEMLEKNTREVRAEDRLDFAKRMIEEGDLSLDKMARLSGIPIEDVRKLAAEMKAN